MSTQKDNNGAMFPNQYKSKDTHPDYKGKITINGQEKAIAGWVKTSKEGKEYLSISISELQEKAESNTFEPSKLKSAPQKMGNIEANFQEDAIRDLQDDDDLPF